MATQKIRLSQIMGNLVGATDFEDQLAKSKGIYEEYYLASEGQTTFTTAVDFAVGKHELVVYVNGLRAKIDEDYVEINSRMFTFKQGLVAGDIILVNILGGGNIIVRNSPGLFQIKRELFIVDASNPDQVQFTTSQNFKVGMNNLEVFKDGILQQLGTDADYVEIDENNFKFNSSISLNTQIVAKITVW